MNISVIISILTRSHANPWPRQPSNRRRSFVGFSSPITRSPRLLKGFRASLGSRHEPSNLRLVSISNCLQGYCVKHNDGTTVNVERSHQWFDRKIQSHSSIVCKLSSLSYLGRNFSRPPCQFESHPSVPPSFLNLTPPSRIHC